MPDFTSSTYLGLRHASVELAPWPQLTTGRPAALSEPPIARQVARMAASLLRCETAVVGTSTLHFAWDVGAWLAPTSYVILDHSTYPILAAAAERARARGIAVATLDRHDVDRLLTVIARATQRGLRPVILTDGYCPACRHVSPVMAYARAVEPAGGLVIMDDTQALGVLGRRDGSGAFGSGGGGTLAWSDVRHPSVVVIASLAKGFGAPLAVLAGRRRVVESFARASGTRLHCSAPSTAALHAAKRALVINRRAGDAIRARLTTLVGRFRAHMRAAGVRLAAGPFPIQSMVAPRGHEAIRLHAALAAAGVNAVLTGDQRSDNACLSFVITAAHTPEDIDGAVAATTAALARLDHPRRKAWARA